MRTAKISPACLFASHVHMPFDLTILPLYRRDGQDRNDLPGLYMVTPPRRTARGRETDRLLLYFTMQGNAPLEDSQIMPLLQRLAQIYYKTPGSITSAMRAGAEFINLFLLERNLRGSSTGRQGTGILVMAVMRNERLTLGHCGPAHTFVITAHETQDLYDPQNSRGLGLTRANTVRYFQLELHPNDLLVLVDQPPPAWTTLTMQNIQTQGADTLRRRLLSQAGPDLSAAIVQVQVGTGKLRLLRPKAPIHMAIQKPSAQEPSGVEAPPKAEEIRSDQTPQGEPSTLAAQEAEHIPQEPQAISATEQAGGTQTRAAASAPAPAASEQSPNVDFALSPARAKADAQETGARSVKMPGHQPAAQKDNRAVSREAAQPVKRTLALPALPKLSLKPVTQRLSAASRLISQGMRVFLSGLYRLLKRILPDESLFTIPTSTMIFVAVAVAVLIATLGGAVYFQRGRQVRFTTFFDQALLAAEQTQDQTDPNELRTGWETVLDFLDQAERYGSTDQSKELRLKAQTALDQLDAIQRLEFQPAIVGGLSVQIQVIRMFVAENDLYLLNGNGGNVLRALRTGKGYELDPAFECGPNPQIGPLVDIEPAPKDNSFKATLLGMDARGNLLYCIPGKQPMSQFPNIPQASEQGLRAFAISSGNLYVLDPGNNQVWLYRNMDINSPPNEYFSADRPNDVQGMIDMAVTGEDVYLLHKDGYIVKCSYGGYAEAPTRCEDPAIYNDDRPGRKNSPVILDARFEQILITPSPEASLFLLDGVNQSVYRFGLRLKFIRQYRAVQPSLGTLATAFAITQNRTIYLVIGNQVYSAVIP